VHLLGLVVAKLKSSFVGGQQKYSKLLWQLHMRLMKKYPSRGRDLVAARAQSLTPNSGEQSPANKPPAWQSESPTEDSSSQTVTSESPRK
jgi:hypothetical protein